MDPSKTRLGCVDPAAPLITSQYVCGARIAASSASTTLTGLSNDKHYTIAVAAYDEADNLGPLSVLQCGTPMPAETFFPQYCADGGQGCGGCGITAVGAGSDGTWPWRLSALLAAVALGARRDARRRETARATRAEEGRRAAR